jgi:hypothetical protein
MSEAGARTGSSMGPRIVRQDDVEPSTEGGDGGGREDAPGGALALDGSTAAAPRDVAAGADPDSGGSGSAGAARAQDAAAKARAPHDGKRRSESGEARPAMRLDDYCMTHVELVGPTKQHEPAAQSVDVVHATGGRTKSALSPWITSLHTAAAPPSSPEPGAVASSPGAGPLGPSSEVASPPSLDAAGPFGSGGLEPVPAVAQPASETSDERRSPETVGRAARAPFSVIAVIALARVAVEALNLEKDPAEL